MIALRLVLDTNVIVSAALKPQGIQKAILLLAITKPANLYVSPTILVEYAIVLGRPELKIRKGLRFQLLQLIKMCGREIRPAKKIRAAADPGDDKFLECAEAARADYLITGNLRHFPRFWKQTKVVTSREFIEIIAPHEES